MKNEDNSVHTVSESVGNRNNMMIVFAVCALLIVLALMFSSAPRSSTSALISPPSAPVSPSSEPVTPSCAGRGVSCPVEFK